MNDEPRQPSQNGHGPLPYKPKHKWDQQPGEPDAAYVRFLHFRELGCTRTITAAYRTYADAQKGVKRRGAANSARAPGQWVRDARSFAWRERADAFDIWRMQGASDRANVAMCELVAAVARRGIELAEDRSKPNSWRGALEIMKELSFMVPKKTIVDGDPVHEPAGEREPGDQ